VRRVDSGQKTYTRKIGLADTLRAAGPYADHILIGESNHENPDILNALYGKEALVTYAEVGTTDLYLEIHTKNQPAIDKLASGKISTREEFTQALKDSGMYLNDTIEDRALVDQLYTTTTMASKLGISVHCGDHGNGFDEMKKSMLANAQFALEIITSEENIEAERAFHKARTNDSQTAEFMNATSQGKSIAIWGAAHGEQKDDWDEKLKGTAIKIDIYASREDYAKAMEERKQINERLGMNIGEDPPEMVYFIKEGELRISDKTPNAIRLAVNEASSPLEIQIATQDIPRNPTSTAPSPSPLNL